MNTLATRPAVGDTLPDVTLIDKRGNESTLGSLLKPGATIVYFMRTSTCPVCNAHLKQIERARNGGDLVATEVIVVVPGGPAEAHVVEGRHENAAFIVRASWDAHAATGLFTKVGLQQSGTFVVDDARVVESATFATVPTGSYDAAAAARAATDVTARCAECA